MKKISVIVLLACMANTSCKKDNAAESAITGKWELREEVGGFAGRISYEPGNGTVWIFNSNRQFQTLYKNGPAVNVTGTYHIKTSARAGDYLLQLQYQLNGQDQSATDSVRFEKNQLLFLPAAACCDIPTSYYERLP